MGEQAVNLRRAQRIELEIPVRISRHADPAADGNFTISSLTELSSEGAFVSTSAAYQPGAMLELEFTLPASSTSTVETRALHALGKVTWQAGGKTTPGAVSRAGMGVGVHFVLLSSKEKELIDSYVAKIAERASSRPVPRA